MGDFDRKKHWESIYRTKALNELSWYQPTPETSLDFVRKLKIEFGAKIIDVGGGDSFLVDHLLDRGFQNITVLDVSEEAIERAKKRLGERAGRIKWIVADIADFQTGEKYDFWHDRAAFHFLTEEAEIANYVDTAKKALNKNGIILVGTFSEQGPEKCSGINIKQYSEKSMEDRFKNNFELVGCEKVDHTTPSGSIQNFLFCSFRKSGLD